MKRMFLAGALLGVMFLQSCNDDYLLNNNNDGGGIPATPGTPVAFSAGLEPEQSASRTVYGKRSGDVFPIYWSHSDDTTGTRAFDDIYIHSPVSGGVNHARYTVKPPSPEFKGMAPVWLADGEEEGIAVGESGTQIFYAFYPYSAVEEASMPAENGHRNWVYINMPASQRVHVPEAADGEDNVHYAESDMNLCYMRAYYNGAVEKDKYVQLEFRPWSTVLDITIPGPSEGEPCLVTNVVVKSVALTQPTIANVMSQYPETPYIAGRCYVYMDETNTVGTNSKYSITENSLSNVINVDICPEGSDKKGFYLRSGKSLNLKVFLAPVSNVEALEIEVQTADGLTDTPTGLQPTGSRTWVKRLNKAEDAASLLEQGQIHPVVMPPIGSKDTGAPDLSSWMSELPDDMPITNLSIPGAYGAYDYFISKHTNSSYAAAAAQTEDVASQFEAGIRAFQLNLVSAMGGIYDPLDPDKTRVGLFGLPGDFGAFGDFLIRLVNVMRTKGPREFCIIELDIETQTNRADHGYICYIFGKYANWLKEAGMLPETKEQGYTIGDLRGKILLQLKLSGDRKIKYSNTDGSISESARKKWNSVYDEDDATDVLTNPDALSMISPLANIQRLLAPSNGSYNSEIYDWYTVDSEFSQKSETLYTTAKPTYLDYDLPYSWKRMCEKYNGGASCPPAMLSYYTTTSFVRPTLTPVAFGKVGDLNYTPKYASQEDYEQYGKPYSNDLGFELAGYREEQYAPVFTGYTVGGGYGQAQGNPNAGIWWMYAYVLWKNMELKGTADGMTTDNVFRTYTDMQMSKIAGNDVQYPMFTNNAYQHYWLHHHEDLMAAGNPTTRNTIIDKMWDQCPEFADVSGYSGSESMVEAYRGLFKRKLFVSTWLGFGFRVNTVNKSLTYFTDYTANSQVLMRWFGYVGNIEVATSDFHVNNRYANIPLGAVYMPYVPNRLANLTWTGLTGVDEARRQTGQNVRSIIKMLIEHSNNCKNLHNTESD